MFNFIKKHVKNSKEDESTNKKKKVIFHIGRPKTGSKAVQFFLYENRELLKKNGILYPESILHEKFHHTLVWSLKGINQQIVSESPEHYYGLLIDEFNSSECNTCVISSEDASIWSDKEYCKRIKNFLFEFDIKIVVYLRRQDHAIESSYNQSVKNSASPFAGTIEEYMLLDQGLDYRAFLEPWEQAFGVENICIRTYEPEHMENGVVGDFLEVLEENINDYVYENKKINPSLDRDALEIVRQINSIGLDTQSRLLLMRKVRKLVNKAKKGNRKGDNSSILSPDMRKSILSDYAESNNLVAKKYLKQENLFRNNIDDDWESYKGLNTDLLIRVLVEYWKENYKNN